MKLESSRMNLSLSISVSLLRWPCCRGVVTVECVFSHMWARLASEDTIVCFLSLWDTVQRCPAGNTHVQQHSFLSRWTWNHRLRYVYLTLQWMLMRVQSLCMKSFFLVEKQEETEHALWGIFFLPFKMCDRLVTSPGRPPPHSACWDMPLAIMTTNRD